MPAGYRLCILWMFVITVLVIKCGNAELTPPYFNLATGRKIYSTATCGVDSDGPELYCKLVGANTEHDNQYFSVIQGQVCDVCDPTRNDKSHPPEYAIDGKETWWQSPPLSRGMKYNEVNLTIDFGQEFHVAYLYIRMGNSPRPGLWTLEKSSDYGQTWSPWQHFSDTTADCETYFGKKSLKPITNDNDVICTTEYSKIVPLENGEIPVMLLNNRPSANNYFNSSVLQEWTRATNIRIRLLRTKNLLGHLMSVVSKDPSVTRRYFYSIKDISIGGRCMCNGHADTCDVLDPRSHRRLLACRCQHRTCGIQCNECCPGFEQKKWRQNTNARPFQCEPCNCFGHSDHCIYDEEIDRLGLSLDIYNKYEGGGVCQNCRHNTEGINCNKCKEKYFRPYGKHWNETNVCTPCNCDFFYSTGNCEEETGRCECRVEYHAPNCDSCAYGYFGYPNCRECECNLNGTVGYHCATTDGKCPCKPNFAGHFCKECSPGYYGYPDCKSCECNEIGSASSNCNSIDGNCTCLGNFGGEKCDRCKHGYYLYPSCLYCDCDIKGTQTEVCDKANGKCLCREGYGGQRCDQCLPGYYNYPNCTPCNCSILGSTSTTCDNTGRCLCLSNFAGKQCTSCSTGFYSYPDCLPCGCDVHGSEGISCNSEGHCSCFDNFDGSKCNACKEGFYNFPACEECNCDPAGVIAKFAGCGSVPEGELCQCKERVSGRICNQCKPLYWNLNISNVDGCEVCDCFLDGTIGSLDTCDPNTGQCFCKPTVGNRQCRECVDGTFDLFGGSLFGCKDCFCDIGGSRNLNCDKSTGQCNCHPRVAGRTCSHPLTTHFFPTLYQFQFEYENGYTPAGTFVRYQFDESQFPKFSGKGYAVFSTIQNEVINEINIFKSSVYRVVIRYINPSHENVTASILITSDNPSELDQSTKVLFKPTSIPTFVTVSGLKAATPSAIVLDPGRYTFSITTDKHILLDYFVLLPAAYYEASILSRKVENPCEIGSLELCRHYSYPPLNEFNPSFYGSVKEKNSFIPPLEVYEDLEHLSIIDQIPNAPTISNLQNSLYYNVSVPRQGQYIIVVDYITDRAKPETYILQVQKDTDPNYGFITMYPCLYTMACRQPVIDSESREKIFNVDPAKRLLLQVYHEHEDFGRVAIISVTAIPVEIWSTDFIEPKPVCIIKDGERIHASYRSVPDSKKVEFGNTVSAKEVPPNIFDEKTVLIGLNQDNSTLSLRSKVLHPGQFLILVKYYQPNYPQYDLLYKLETKKMLYEGKFHVSFCPSNIGCRALIAPSNNNTFEIDDEFRLSLTNTRPKNFWIEYMLVVPAEEYDNNLLQEEKFDQTKEFIKKCGQDHFHIQLNASEFCRKTVFSLTANYNDGALPCNCDYDGSTSFECDPFGGQCPCKPNVIGRQCDSCKTGYYGFPDCKHCDCPLTALCEKDTGECICPPNVIGEKCDKCEPYTYGFHQIIGCEQCKCHPLGVEDGNLQCDLLNGSCICGAHIEGRTCDECSNGFFGFPDCKSCKCNIAGTTFKVCDKRDESCFCKENVIGSHCEYCAEGTYNLQQSNPEGCTKCFCFGKTNRCESAYLRVFNVSILKNVSVNTVSIENGEIEIEQWKIPVEEIVLNETSLQVDFSYGLNRGLVYVGMLHYLGSQNNHLTSYGGVLEYTLYYTTGPFGSALYGPDIILHSENCILIHQSYSQPANAQIFNGKVILIETNFQTIDNRPVPREQFMMALRNLNTIYIRASYWEETIITQISDVFLSMADEDEEKIYYQQLPVEKCYCPPGYSGLSCEDCAPGYYRDPNGPFGGYCIPCQCNGHSSACDCHTGICEECTHFTTGDHCEKCITGYHGNATLGTPFDCMICACPLPYESNNFATSCEISDSGIEIHCHCLEGYFGPRCESCASGYYGQPEKIGSSCQRCDCSGNINPDEPGSCDTVTGDCLKCLNNTHGKACNLCAPGYYGDAIKLKDCRSCDCEFLGTKYCDSFIGTCNCHDNVIGNRCDSCDDNFYGYDSGMGCKPCNCAVASQNSQCDLHSGDCICMPGVSGRQCDRCSADHWNYTANGCVPCSCNKGFSRGFGCNPESGHCECLPGVIGEKCDACPHRWLFVKDTGCSECDACIHALLDFIDSTDARIDPLVKDFHTVALSYFTSQKLSYFNKLSDIIEPKVKSLNPRSINLAPLKREVESLHADSKLLNQLTGVASNNSKDLFLNGGKLRKNAKDILDESQLIAIKTFDTIKEVENFENSFDTTTSTKAENALTEVKIIFGELTKDNENSNAQNDPSQLENSRNLVSDTEFIMIPIKWQNDTVFGLKKDIDSFNGKLSDLKEWSNASNVRTNTILNLTERNRENFKNSKFEVVSNQTFDVENDVAKSIILFQNTDLTIDAINKNLVVLKDGLEELKDGNKKVDELLPRTEDDYNSIHNAMEEGEMHIAEVIGLANKITGRYSNITSNSEQAIKAATVYSDILKGILDAQKILRNAKYAAANATEKSKGVRDRANQSRVSGQKLLQNAKTSLKIVSETLGPHLNKSSDAVSKTLGFNNAKEDQLKAMNLALESLPRQNSVNEWDIANEKATKTLGSSKMAVEMLLPINSFIPGNLMLAQQLPKDIDTSSKEISQTENHLDKVEALGPRLSALVGKMDKKQAQINLIGSDISDRLNRLKKKIEMARNLANGIDVGVTFHPNTVLELKNPDNLSRLATNFNISFYFNTTKPNGFLFYLGNENKNNEKTDKSQDFVAVEVENGYPVLTVDLGSGPEKFISKKNVADGEWYQAIITRTMDQVKLTIKEETPDGNEEAHVTEHLLSNKFLLFDVDENSKLFAGGYSADFTAPEDLRYSSFDGQIEKLKIQDEYIGLWNFVDGGENMEGALRRNRLLSQEMPPTGYRFSGNGYVVLDTKPHHFKTRSTIHFRFKCSTDSSDGLLFYTGQGDHYLSVELVQGAIYFKYKLGEHKVVIGSNSTLNDNLWHRVEAERDGYKGVLKIDGKDVYQEELLPGSPINLMVSDQMYFGGIFENVHPDIQSNGFDGCIDDVVISGTPVDLSQNVKAYGVRPGCPEKFSASVSFKPGGYGYLSYGNVSINNGVFLSFKFLTKKDEGILFYAGNNHAADGIGLYLINGNIVLRCMEIEFSTNSKSYSDGQWHFVNVKYDDDGLILYVDNVVKYRSLSSLNALFIQSGRMFIGGLSQSDVALKGVHPTLENFIGCISDFTLNGNILNFASTVDRTGADLDMCLESLNDTGSSFAIPREDVHMKNVTYDFGDNVYENIDEKKTWADNVTSSYSNADNVEKFTPEFDTPVSPKKPMRTRPHFVSKGDSECMLPWNPSLEEIDVVKAGFRFGTAANSRMEIKQIPNKVRKGFDVSLEFKTTSYEGLLFYAADANHTDFVALYLKGGKVHYTFHIAQKSVNMSSDYHYNDNKWHEVTITRSHLKGQLILRNDDITQGELPINSKGLINYQSPFYVGDVDPQLSDDLNLNLQLEKGTLYEGCIRALKIQNRLVPNASFHPKGVIPCSEEVEKGIYFTKGYVKLRDKFNVGAEFTVSFDIKPRVTTGMLLSVHGKNAYLILQMLNGTINFTVDNGEGPIVATFKPNPGENLCDGHWRTVEAIKSQYVITLIVNAVSSQPAIGSASHPLTETTRPLFMGGHPHIMKVRGLTARKPFVGCIRNLKIKGQPEKIGNHMTFGDVQTGVCPTN